MPPSALLSRLVTPASAALAAER